MIPYLLPADAADFDASGLPLPDAVSCTVKQDSSARSELTMQYPVIGDNYDAIKKDMIIMAKPDPFTRAQPYRVYKVGKVTNGLVTFSARHLAYDALGYPVAPFVAHNAAEAATLAKQRCLIDNALTLSTDSTKTAEMVVEKPLSLRAVLATDSNSILNTYGGAILFDRREILHRVDNGQNRGVVIRYGVDLIDLQQEENIANTYNGILPFWSGTRTTMDGDEIASQLPETVLGAVCMAAGTWPVVKVLPVDMTDYFGDGNPPTAAALNALAPTWIADHRVGVPEVSIKLQYAQTGQDVRLCDVIGVEFPLLGVSTDAKVTATSYDVLREIYTDIQVGDPRPEISDSLMDASRLRRGTIDAGRIGTGSIGGRHLGTASVSEAALQAYAVTKNRLASLSVTTPKLAGGAVTKEKLAVEIVEKIQYASDKADSAYSRVVTLDAEAARKSELLTFETETASNFAAVNTRVDANSSSIQNIVQVNEAQGQSIAEISQRVDDHSGQISSIVSVNNGQDTAISAIKQWAGFTDQGAPYSYISLTADVTQISGKLEAFTITANSVTVNRSLDATGAYVKGQIFYEGSTADGDHRLTAKTHTHFVTVDGGKVTIGNADITGTEHPFDIADTQFYKDGVSAAHDDGAETASVGSSVRVDWSNLRNPAGDTWWVDVDVQVHPTGTLYDGSTYTAAAVTRTKTGVDVSDIVSDSYDRGYSAGYAAVTVTSLTASRPTYDANDKSYTIPLAAGASNGATRTSSATVNASAAYNAGVSDGRVGYTKGTFEQRYVVLQGTENSYSRNGLLYRKTSTGEYKQMTTALYNGGSGAYYYAKTS